MTIARIKEWFDTAVPNPTPRNFTTQLGCDLEEGVELLESLQGDSPEADERLKVFIQQMHEFAESMKRGEIPVSVKNRVAFLDAVCDKIVTGTGLAAYEKMDIEPALDTVNASNWSKFDEFGKPIFDDNNKIMKSEHYFKPDLTAFV